MAFLHSTATREPDMMEQWTTVDGYIAETLFTSDDALDHALRTSAEAGLPPHHVSLAQGRFLQLVARACGARKILEIGTLAGYSTIWLARALPTDGRLLTLEFDPQHAEVARANLAYAGLASLAEVRCGRALDLLPQLTAEGLLSFDLIFIDADKASSADYFAWAVNLSRVGSIIIVDNVVRDGALADSDSKDPSVLGVRRLHEIIATEPRVTATTIQTVGCKGYDGFTFALVTSE
jgi:predicted O-methyltransferase YrrM